MKMLKKRVTTTQARKADRPERSRHSPRMGWALTMPPMSQRTLFCGTSSRSMQGYTEGHRGS
jgi:hypothetical protein